MQTIYQILIFVLFGGLIGYLTNLLAIYMLFHPKKEFLGIKGVLPKRKKKLAKNISENIFFILPENYKKITRIPIIGEKFDTYLKQSIEKTIYQTPDEEIEKIVKKVAKTELRFIEILGGIVGMLVGFFQWILFFRIIQ